MSIKAGGSIDILSSGKYNVWYIVKAADCSVALQLSRSYKHSHSGLSLYMLILVAFGNNQPPLRASSQCARCIASQLLR